MAGSRVGAGRRSAAIAADSAAPTPASRAFSSGAWLSASLSASPNVKGSACRVAGSSAARAVANNMRMMVLSPDMVAEPSPARVAGDGSRQPSEGIVALPDIDFMQSAESDFILAQTQYAIRSEKRREGEGGGERVGIG